MQKLADNNYWVKSKQDLDEIPHFQTMYADFETTSRDPGLMSVDPWHHCWPLGVAVSGGGWPDVWYVPWNIGRDWFCERLNEADKWINHNIKYDAHVLLNDGCQIPDHVQLICTIAMAHLIDADRQFKGGYSLDMLARKWLKRHKLGGMLTPYTRTSKDYGDIPQDILAEYANGDVLVNIDLYHYMLAKMPPESHLVWQNEIALTKVLLGMERIGLCIDLDEVSKAKLVSENRTNEIESILHYLLGYPYNPRSPKQMHELIEGKLGYPVKKYTNEDADGKETEDSNPCYDKEVLEWYLNNAETPIDKKVFEYLIEHRDNAQHVSLFYEPWQKLHVDGVLHSSYNQNLKTGRLSCRQPNAQQLDKQVKALVKPKPGHMFFEFDYSQIEYRVIINYLKTRDIIAEYKKDPRKDYHQWVADKVGINRRNAKTLNFSIAFGAGKKKTTDALVINFRTMGEDITIEEAAVRAEAIYKTYHRMMPELRKQSKTAERLAQQRGFIRNLVGRHLHLPGPSHNIAFNKKGEIIDRCHIALCGRAVQSTAADIAKFRAVQIQPLLRELGVDLVAMVHDSFLFQLPKTDVSELRYKYEQIKKNLEEVPEGFPEMSVPLCVDGAISDISWADAYSRPEDEMWEKYKTL